MFGRHNICIVILAGMLSAIGCSGGNVTSPAPPDESGLPVTLKETESNRSLWGIWEISLDPGSLEVVIEPIRNPQAHYNITVMVTLPACDDCVMVEVNSFDPVTRILDADVTLRNPTQLTGYDVRGILYTNDYGHLLTNADDWTGLWDIPGGEILNPFKAFAKSETNRMFAGEAQHTENYEVYIPIPPLYYAITFAVDASWPGNCKEPYTISEPIFPYHDVLYYENGSKLYFTVEVLDWQQDVDEVTLSVPGITGEDSTPFYQVDDETWGVEITNNTGAPAGEYEATIKATSTNSGTLAIYDVILLSVRRGWARTWGDIGIYNDTGEGVAIDGSGNAYITGRFEYTVDFDPGPGVDEHTSNGLYDAFLSKFDSTGEFQWSRTLGGISDDKGNGVAIDGSGNAYITGSFSDSADFDPGPGVDEHTSNGYADIFLSKFDSEGDFQWARTLGGFYYDTGWGVAIDGSGNAYITGSFHGTVDFDPGIGVNEHTSNGEYDIFLSKFDSAGEFQWARNWGGIWVDAGKGVAIDGSGNAYITGYFYYTVDCDPGPGVDEHTSNGFWDIFLSKFDSAGEFQWARTWGGGDYDLGFGVAIDGSGSAYITGFYEGTVDFNPGPGVDEHTSNGSRDIFLSKFDSAGEFQWARTWGGIHDYDEGKGVAIDGGGNAYITGYFRDTADFDPGPGVDEHASLGENDVFLSKFDSTGVFQWARTWGGSSYDGGYGVAIDGSGNAYITGDFVHTVDFDPGIGVDEHTSNGWYDIFLSKFPPDGNW